MALDKSNILYVSTYNSLYAASLDDLVLSAEISDFPINGSFVRTVSHSRADSKYSDTETVMKFGGSTRTGQIKFEHDFRLMCMYDTD